MWEKVRLKETIEKPISGEWGSDNGTIPVIRTTNFTNDGTLNVEHIVLRDIPNSKVDKKRLEIGDTIIEKSGGSPKQPVGRVVYFDKEGIYLCNNFTSIIRPKESVYPKYLFWRLFLAHSNNETLKYQNKTTGIINLKLENYINDLHIPLPPLPVQQRIADMLDKADALRRKDRELLKKYDELAQAIFIDMFGDPVKNEKGWEVKKLGEIAQLQGGYAFKSKDYKPDGVRLVKITNVHKNELIWTDVDYLPPIFLENYKSYSLDIGDIVMAMTRPVIKSLDGIKVVCVTKSDLPCLLNQRVGRFVIKKGELNNIFLYSSCNTQYFKDKIEKLSSISLQPNISSKQVEEIKIPVPPLDLQEAFARKIEAINLLKAKTNKEKSAKLFQSLLQRAFKGDLGQRY